jgi:hypothetical protein
MPGWHSRRECWLRGGFEKALVALGDGFLKHPANAALREALITGALDDRGYFQELLRLVYRFIFLFTAEDRDLLHPPQATEAAKRLYAEGYSLSRLRDRAVRRAAYDAHYDLYEGVKLVSARLVVGEPKLALPALGGLFLAGMTPHLERARLDNRALLTAIFDLGWLADRESGGIERINWRDMETEELGSVYESLLELTPRLETGATGFSFAEGAETKGNARKTSGSYYTPDALVQLLLDSALDPVIEAAVEANPGREVEALLGLDVLDPACGSGHFLLAAARRIAQRIVQTESPGAPSLDDYRHASREVARHCLYGVDRNPLAVELCKVALWIETVEPGKPLSFLDGRIREGDSLIGVFDLAILGDGIPDEAYKALTGDDKAVARYYVERNRKERRGRPSLPLAGSLATLTRAARSVEAMPEDNVAEIEKKAAAFTALAKRPEAWDFEIACDLFVAPFFAPKIGAIPGNPNTVTIPTTDHLWRKLDGQRLYPPLEAAGVDAAKRVGAFHWPIEFPEVFAKGGFDCVIGNPPWERVKLQEEEFFAFRDPEIAKAKNAAARKRLIEALAVGNPNLAAEWAEASHQAASESAFLRFSSRFPLGGVGDVNTYAVFADLFRQSINAHGGAALLLPNGLVTGFTYRAFLTHLLQSRTLASFYGFENEDKIFPDVHNETKFGILTIAGQRRQVNRPWFTAHVRQPEQIHDPLRRYPLTADQIEAINPNTLNLPAFRWAADADVASAIHAAAPVLIRRHGDGRVVNPWGVSFSRLFDMANDSGMFLDHTDIAPRIVERCGALAVLDDGSEVYPLYEGKMSWHFDHRYGTYEGQTDKQANKGVLPHVGDAAHADPNYRVRPRYWVDAGKVREALGDDAKRQWFFAWRDVGPTERTLVGCLVPRTAAGHATPLLTIRYDAISAAALVGVLSSLVVDYDARQKSNRMTFFVVEQLAVLTPAALAVRYAWLGKSAGDWLADRVLELSYTNVELTPFARDLGCAQPPFLWSLERRVLLQAEIDAAVLHLYGLTRDQSEWLLDSFTVLRKYEERDHREFRTKRLVLEIYDALVEARRTGFPYHTRLLPPPADSRCCHPPCRVTNTRESIAGPTSGDRIERGEPAQP